MTLDAAQEVSLSIDAPLVECFDAILEFERYPEWSSAVTAARVLERDASGVGHIVEFYIDMKIRTLRYVLEYTYRRPAELTWHSVEGDVESIQGRYTFRKVAPNRTEAVCRQEIQLGFWLPGPLRKLAERTALRQSVAEFKAEVERRRAGAKPSDRPRRKSKRER